MRKLVLFIIGISILTMLVAGCGSKSGKMNQARKKNPQGLAMQGPQINEGEGGRAIFEITEEMTYPGMEAYEGAKYEFITADAPEKVAEWFGEALKGSSTAKKTGKRGGNTKYTIKQNKFIINLIPYGGSGTLIRYKIDITK